MINSAIKLTTDCTLQFIDRAAFQTGILARHPPPFAIASSSNVAKNEKFSSMPKSIYEYNKIEKANLFSNCALQPSEQICIVW